MMAEYYNYTYKGTKIDVYRILKIYNITEPAQQHAIKKLLRAGKSIKSIEKEIDEVIESLNRWKEMIQEENKEIKRCNMKEKFYLILSQEFLENRPEWPDKIPLVKGKYECEYDVVESELPLDFVAERRKISKEFYERNYELTPMDLEIMEALPMGIDSERLPKGIKIIKAEI
jgi:hypothetical protein